MRMARGQLASRQHFRGGYIVGAGGMQMRRSAALDVLVKLDHASAHPEDREDPFISFLMAEYNNIANAHFNTVESLANFIKHYLLVASAPIFLLVLFADLKGASASDISTLLSIEPLLTAILGTMLFATGLLLLGYVTNIRCDTLLYARTVNGIRNHFYGFSSLKFHEELDVRVLPKSVRHPPYYEGSYFLFVVLLFASIGIIYFGGGWYVYWQAMGHDLQWWFFASLVAGAAGHVMLYRVLTNWREGMYPRQNVIGVDIDGVLNRHRHQFAFYLHQYTEKHIDPDLITHIPVHEIPGTTVTSADEHAVFNSADYWETMPVSEPSPAEWLRKIRNSLGYKIWIFTYRPWPQGRSIPQGKADSYWARWHDYVQWMNAWDLKWWDRFTRWCAEGGVPIPYADFSIRVITRRWLRRAGIPYHKLIVERGNTDTPDPQSRSRNRFVLSRNHRIRAFVEDDLTKARKLAQVCEVVFLIDQPYNKCNEASLPNNVVRVDGWPQVFQIMRTRL
jgi:uncharacterized HAD superfamily protein